MSFVSATRDYVEILDNISNSLGTDFTVNKFFSESLFYFFRTLQYSFSYIISFQWLRDFTLLPIIIPQVSNSIFKETFFLDAPSKVFFDFLEIPNLNQNKFLLGFFNSVFFTLPISITHIFSIRRLLIQGVPAGVFSIGGYLFGQILFLTSVLFGLRVVLVPWLTFEPLTYALGLFIVFQSVYKMTQENLRELSGWNNPQYGRFFFTSLVLAWCEQSSLFQYLGNISLTANSSIIESFSTNSTMSSFLTHSVYLLGITLGSLLFTCFWGWFFLQVKNWCILYTPLFLSSFVQAINKASFIFALSLSLSSIPFYGFDYLLTNPLGFVSQDRVFKNTIFDQYNIKDSLTSLGPISNFQSLDIDISAFDRGRYLIFPESPQLFSFEDLNYKGEAEWTNRFDKLSGITDSRAGFFTLSKLFKKQKTNSISPSTVSEQNIFEKANSLLSDNKSKLSIVDDTTNIGARFSDWYDLKSENLEDVTFESIFRQFSDFSFPTDFLRTEAVVEKNIEEKIKSKYYSNPVYQNLLKLDIDFFLRRQPENYKLTGTNELDLYTKRQMLSSYYDSLRDYSKLPYIQNFENFFDGSKTFSNKVYNQQFKGTLRSVRRLFLLTINPNFSQLQDKKSTLPVLKFDQPLYDFPPNLQSTKQNVGDKKFSPYHEELNEITQSSILNKSQTPFLEEILTQPLYAGWDENLRKFVITNKLLSRNLAGYKIKLTPEIITKFSPDVNKKGLVNKKSMTTAQKIKFTSWPLSKEKLDLLKRESETPYVTLYESKTDPKNQDIADFELFETLPSNWQTIQLQKQPYKNLENVFDYLAPKRGGFIWPGDAPLSKPTFFPNKK